MATKEEIAEAAGDIVTRALDIVAPNATNVKIQTVNYNTDTRKVEFINFYAELPDGTTMRRSSITVQL
jgi:hypothetical protein